MNYIRHLTGFFEKVADDQRLNPAHISLYVSLFQCWNTSRFINPISITRSELMKISKIGSKATYHKCMKDLHQFGYISYHPSFNPMRGSLVNLYTLQPGNEQAPNRSPPKNKTGSRQVLVPSINSINNKKQINKLNSSKKIDDNNSKNYSEPL